MPKVKQINYKQERIKANIPPPNYLSELFTRYMKAQHITTDILAAQLNCTGQNVRYKLSRPAAAWKIGEIESFCDLLNCPVDMAFEAITISRR